jgi:hypothetical protein
MVDAQIREQARDILQQERAKVTASAEVQITAAVSAYQECIQSFWEPRCRKLEMEKLALQVKLMAAEQKLNEEAGAHRECPHPAGSLHRLSDSDSLPLASWCSACGSLRVNGALNADGKEWQSPVLRRREVQDESDVVNDLRVRLNNLHAETQRAAEVKDQRIRELEAQLNGRGASENAV